MKVFLSLLPVFFFLNYVQAENQHFNYSIIQITSADSLPVEPSHFAGAYTGTDDGVVIVAGGVNFPDSVSLEGGTRRYCDEIFILKKAGDEYQWEKAAEEIPYASAYGGAVETPSGLLCFGGNTTNESISESWFIDYNPVTEHIEIKPGPALPLPFTHFAFAEVNGNMYVAGGISELSGPSGKHFLRLLMTGSNPQHWTWEKLSSWEGKPRAFATGVGQSDGASNCFYLFSGKNVQPGKEAEILNEAHVFDPYLNRWSVIFDGKQKAFPFVAGRAFPVGAATIIFPLSAPDTLKITIDTESRHLGFMDAVVVALYFLVLSVMGWFFSKRQKNTNDYFKGGGRVPWWAAGLSIFGTALSAITFMAIPAKTFAADWSYFMLNMTIFMVAPLIVFLFIPFYRKMNITTAYEYLEVRFNVAERLISSLSFILF